MSSAWEENLISFSNTQAAAWVYLNGLLTNGNAVFKFNENTNIAENSKQLSYSIIIIKIEISRENYHI